jgi:hypothetical protein
VSAAVDRHHYLAALGIDVWVRRSLDAPAAAPEADPDRTEAPAGTPEPAAAEPVAREAEAPPAPESAPARSARALLDVVETGATDTPAPPPVEPPAPPPATEASAESPPAPPDAVPEFRLTILTLGGAMALVDEAVLGEDRAARQRLGDLLRVARRLHCGDAAGRLEVRTFFWPQVEGDAVDQGPEAATQALAAFARRHTEADDGLLVLVEPPADAPARAPLLNLETLPRARARIPAAFVAAPGADGARAAWAALRPLGRTDAS